MFPGAAKKVIHLVAGEVSPDHLRIYTYIEREISMYRCMDMEPYILVIRLSSGEVSSKHRCMHIYIYIDI